MKFLDLVNRLATEAAVSGRAASVATVVGQTGQALNLVNWIASAYNDLQTQRDNWRWLRSRFTVNTVANTDTYAPTDCTDSRLNVTISRFARWWLYSEIDEPGITRYLTSGGVGSETWLVPLIWPTFRRIYKRGAQTLVRNNPVHVTIDPQENLVLGANPDNVYTIQGEYQMGPQVLALDADVPEMPTRFHDLIWLHALGKYGRFSAAPEALLRAQTEGGQLMSDLEESQLPSTVLQSAGPLA